MKTRFISVALLVIVSLMTLGQRPNLDLTFTADNNGTYIQFDSIKVMNRIQGGDTVLYFPDTVLVLDYEVGISQIPKIGNVFQVFQNYPNPVSDQTTISLYVPDKDKVSMIITDILGKVILKSDRVLDQGTHYLRITPGGAYLYFFTAYWRGSTSSSIKILHVPVGSNLAASMEYLGSEITTPQLKVMEDIQGFTYTLGDELLYIGYADTLESGILDTPEESQTYTFHFATNIPCPGTPTVEYEGQIYNTIQIFSQCWMKENLNVGTMIPGNQEMTDNEIMEKYCYENDTYNCNIYGGLYQWDEMMQYTTTEGTQGICPSGWHLPTDEEWKVLEGSVDSHFGIGDQIWDFGDFRGHDAGTNLKTSSGWNGGGNGIDLLGFSGLPGGDCYGPGNFINIGYNGYWRSSTSVCARCLNYDRSGVCRTLMFPAGWGFSARCIRDY